MNLQSWKNRIATKIALFLLTTLTVSLLPNCMSDTTTDGTSNAISLLKAIVGAG
jgi:hypothetical protein